MTDSLSLAEARRIALAAQGFDRARPEGQPPARRLKSMIGDIGLLQLDSVNVVTRSHYVPLFSRLGAYDRESLDRMGRGAKRALFEYWGHEASLIPVDMFPLFRWRMERAAKGQGIYGGLARFAKENRAFLDAVVEEIAAHGPLVPSQLSDGGRSEGGWWGWGKGKRALEYLFWAGRVTTAERRGFERVYDLTERVIPSAIYGTAIAADEAQRRLLETAARACGIGTEADLRDYFRLPVADTKARLAELVDAGRLHPMQVEGWKQRAYLHADAEPARTAPAAALLSPFDSLIWMRPRVERLFGFHYRLAFYTPKHKRAHGYYVMPFLFGDRLVARVDLKSDRRRGRLQALAGHAEAGVDEREIAPALRAELMLMANWLGLEGLDIKPRGQLLRALRAAAPAKLSAPADRASAPAR